MEHFDGNAAAGELSDVFSFDVTFATATCAGCGVSGSVAQAMVYESPMGTVLRCPECSAVLLRLVRGGGAVRVELRGVRLLTWGDA